MDSRYSYDENSETWPVFVLALTSVAVVPLTIAKVYSALSTNVELQHQDAIEQRNIPPQVLKHRSDQKRRSSLTKKNIFLVFGWIVIAAMIYLVSTTEQTPTQNLFDPYELLGVEFGTPEKVIKSTYRKLSVKYHPDKIKGASEEEMKELEERFVLITKAYKALTDEETKENYEKYGHPDGAQPVSHGIALPKFLVEGKSSPLLLALYIALIGGALPYVVGTWWSQVKKVTKRGIYSDTAEEFITRLMNQNPAKHVGMSTILTWLSNAAEYKDLLPGKTPEQIYSLYEEYLNRKPSDDALTAVSIVPTLINGLFDITANFRSTEITLTVVDTLKHFTQALPEGPKNELLQLPCVDTDAVNKSKIVKLGRLTTLPRDEIKQTLGIKDDAELEEALRVGTRIPKLDLISAKFEVPGETVVTPSSTSVINVKVAVKSARHHKKASVSQEKLEEDQSLEAMRDPFKIVHAQPPLPLAHAPFFPSERHSGYVGFIVLQRDGKICDQPVLFRNLDLSNLDLSETEFKDGKKVTVGTFKLPVSQPTPAQPGKYQFRVIIKSLDYFTQDIDTSVTMHVQEPPKIEEVNYDIPDPEENSLAGTMAELRGEKVKSGDSDDEDEEESDLEEEEDFTDINTDTEEEEDDED
ncbi:unnamed protein product [Cyberlindnera jadinii]|uniref:J domain-containing protein n=1 Tax=Cyberlindnera jadinii (strain ATCC 18201 / CBS 1600 / BCRC 20928 / JCM 3617 / NBRC 0987 / NRRL Y-1542) TaxID=983966 RepID=A0A0H5C9I6_CYBJN|nr:unnamed protein product [Cyberlindnera jadinii]